MKIESPHYIFILVRFDEDEKPSLTKTNFEEQGILPPHPSYFLNLTIPVASRRQ
jgi:hypothetical protein